MTPEPPRRPARYPVVQAAAALAAALLLVGCGPARATPTNTSGRTVTVFAAASLTEVFDELGEAFEAEHPDVRVVFSYGASSTLARQIVQGAPADVFAAADPATMRVVTAAGAARGEPVTVARNTLQIAVPPGNPGRVGGVADLARPELRIALCADAVPCGAAARRVLAAAGVVPRPDTLERDVRAALTKVRLGEVDAALVYRTDVLAAGDSVVGVDIPPAVNTVNDYQLVTLAEAAQPATARDFVAFVASARGREVLRSAGFRPP